MVGDVVAILDSSEGGFEVEGDEAESGLFGSVSRVESDEGVLITAAAGTAQSVDALLCSRLTIPVARASGKCALVRRAADPGER